MKSLSKVSKNITLAIFTLSVFFSASAFTPTQNFSATCPIGYVKNAGGVCVVVTNQRPVVSRASKKMAANALCLGIKNWTPKAHKACMKKKGF